MLTRIGTSQERNGLTISQRMSAKVLIDCIIIIIIRKFLYSDKKNLLSNAVDWIECNLLLLNSGCLCCRESSNDHQPSLAGDRSEMCSRCKRAWIRDAYADSGKYCMALSPTACGEEYLSLGPKVSLRSSLEYLISGDEIEIPQSTPRCGRIIF